MSKRNAIAAFLLVALLGFLAGHYIGGARGIEAAHKKHVLYYVDPMHPGYRSDKPGIAPDCGMALEPVFEEEAAAAKLQLPFGAVSVRPEQQEIIGVRVEPVTKNSGTRVVRTTGRVEADANSVYRLMAATEGWVQSLENNPPGRIVKKNEVLATFYSVEFRKAEQQYLISLNGLERAQPRPGVETSEQIKAAEANLRTAEESLHSLGMSDPQIKELGATHKETRDIRVVSPVDGVVLSRNISPEQRFERGTEFYRIANLNKVWILADLIGDEAKLLPPGTKAKVTVRELSKTLYATININPPLFDSASRALKIRLDADNPGLTLRPDMFVDLEFTTKIPAGLSIPADAVLDSGLRKIVYVEIRAGVFEPRPVELGAAYGNLVTVIRGLSEGERVVTSGNFLIDSESRMSRVQPLSLNSKPAKKYRSATTTWRGDD